MSADPTWTVWCDGERCDAFHMEGETATAARAKAKAQGWVRRRTDEGFVDLCSECAEAHR